MLKIKKGLKKKIKGKKGKGKEDDLFDPEQLEKYRKELEEKRKAAGEAEDSEDPSGAASSSQNNHEKDEEWLKFQALTAGVDTILKKTTQDLGKIKESSFYQRKPTDPTNLWRPDAPSSSQAAAEAEEPSESGANWVDLAEGSDTEEAAENQEKENTDPQQQFFDPEGVEPDVLDDSLFDTSYLDAIASGEIQLAYIPDSPTEDDGDDPFDTSGVADVVKRIEEAEKQAKRQVNLEGAVNVLSGKGGPTLESKPRPRPGESSKKARARPRAVNLLGDFETEGSTDLKTEVVSTSSDSQVPKDIFDEILGSPIQDLGTPLLEKVDPSILIKSAVPNSNNKKESLNEKDTFNKDIIGEFDLINQSIDEPLTTVPVSTTSILASILGPPEPEEPEEDEFDAEFAALAAESVHKGPSPFPQAGDTTEEPLEKEEEDPFDTTFVEKVAPPGKFELKLIESEVLGENESNLNEDDDFDFNPRAGESLAPGTVCPNPSPRSLLEDHSPTGEHPPAIEPHFKSGEPLIVDTSEEQDTEVDPFDTSKVEAILPGKVELRLLEEELLKAVEYPKPKRPALPIILSAPPVKNPEEDDDDFDPRKDEPKEEPDKAPDYLFDTTLSTDDVATKVLTPQQEPVEVELDPFDTSIASSIILGPGQLELRLLESELVSSEPQQHQQESIQKELEDPEFDPRGGEEPDPFIVPVNTLLKTEDIFDCTDDFSTDKPLIPQQEFSKSIAPESSHGDFEDPFDTSSIEVLKLLPPSELKQIEGELLNAPTEIYQPIKPIPPTAPITVSSAEEPKKDVPPTPPPVVQHLFETDDPLEREIGHKPLTPLEVPKSHILDPFDTSIAEKVVPGKAEIKFLEQELLVAGASPFDLSSEEFNPRGPQPIHPSALSFVSKTLEPQRVSDQQNVLSDDIDPFDTSAADIFVPTSIPTGPGKSELKALEAELLK